MKIISIKMLLALTIISFLSTNAFAETNVSEITIYTDSTWKVLDAEVNGWASIDFNDSYWPNAKEGDPAGNAKWLDYPEKPSSPPYYFRKTFELSGAKIISGKLFSSGLCPRVYVNNNNTNLWCDSVDITKYLKVGKNIIAAESSALGLVIRIRVSDYAPSPAPTSAITPTPIATSTLDLIPTLTATPVFTPMTTTEATSTLWPTPTPTVTPAPTSTTSMSFGWPLTIKEAAELIAAIAALISAIAVIITVIRNRYNK